MGKVISSSVRFPKARVKKEPAINGDGRTRVKYSAAVCPSKAKPRAICQAPPKPRLHHVQVPKIGNRARRTRRNGDPPSPRLRWAGRARGRIGEELFQSPLNAF